ncbi:MAG: hypothetical protein ACQESC_02705 [Nanobdellota archaeon]
MVIDPEQKALYQLEQVKILKEHLQKERLYQYAHLGEDMLLDIEQEITGNPLLEKVLTSNKIDFHMMEIRDYLRTAYDLMEEPKETVEEYVLLEQEQENINVDIGKNIVNLYEQRDDLTKDQLIELDLLKQEHSTRFHSMKYMIADKYVRHAKSMLDTPFSHQGYDDSKYFLNRAKEFLTGNVIVAKEHERRLIKGIDKLIERSDFNQTSTQLATLYSEDQKGANTLSDNSENAFVDYRIQQGFKRNCDDSLRYN